VFEQSKKVHCLPSDCKILITNFVSADDQTSRFGMQIADAFSEQLSKGDKPFSVVDRSVFQSFLQRQRLSSRLQGEKSVAQWLARQLGANAVIVGRTTKSGDNLLKLSVDLLDALGENRKTLTLKMSLTVDFSTLDLSPTDGLARLTPLTDTLNSEKVYQAGMQRAGFPSCFYMPNPTYTQDARNGH